MGQLEHVRLDLYVRDVVEILLRVPGLVWIAERGGYQPLASALSDRSHRHKSYNSPWR